MFTAREFIERSKQYDIQVVFDFLFLAKRKKINTKFNYNQFSTKITRPSVLGRNQTKYIVCVSDNINVLFDSSTAGSVGGSSGSFLI